MTRRRMIITDIVLVLFSFLNILAMAYYGLKSQTGGCGERYLIETCTNPSYGGFYELAGIIFGVLYGALLAGILLKSSVSLYRSLRSVRYKK